MNCDHDTQTLQGAAERFTHNKQHAKSELTEGTTQLKTRSEKKKLAGMAYQKADYLPHQEEQQDQSLFGFLRQHFWIRIRTVMNRCMMLTPREIHLPKNGLSLFILMCTGKSHKESTYKQNKKLNAIDRT